MRTLIVYDSETGQIDRFFKGQQVDKKRHNVSEGMSLVVKESDVEIDPRDHKIEVSTENIVDKKSS